MDKEKEKKKAKKAAQKEKKKLQAANAAAGSNEGDVENSPNPPDFAEVKEASVEPDDPTASSTAKKATPANKPLSKKEQEGARRAAMIKKLQAQKQAEDEEMRRKEAEVEARREEFLRQKEERERIEREKKERKKQREKEKIARMKKEGTWLTEKQKKEQAKFQQMLAERQVQLATLGDSTTPAEDGEAASEAPAAPKPQKPKYETLSQKRKKIEQNEKAKADTPLTSDDKTHEEQNGKENLKEALEKTDDLDDWEKQYEDILQTKEAAAEKDAEVIEGESGTSSSTEESGSDEDEDPLVVAERMVEKHHRKCEKYRNTDKLRCPVICVLGHVDTGKTKILDKLRKTNVQDGEAGGITQQIGATNVPQENIQQATKHCRDRFDTSTMKVPGLLIIDTPGHESFGNLRDRGSSLCDLAILVVDVMHSLERQTLESIQLLKKRKTPFVVALNKIDRLVNFQSAPDKDVEEVMRSQSKATQQDFRDRVNMVVADFAKEEINVRLFYDPRPAGVSEEEDDFVCLVPTSAHTGDGMGNLLTYLCQYAQSHLAQRLAFSEELQAIVMEVKEIQGLGTTIDVILINGRLREGDTVIVPGQEGPIVSQIRALLMPAPMRELRVKGSYDHFKEIVAAQGVKICAKDLEKALAGLPMYVANDPLLVNYYKDLVTKNLESALRSIAVTDDIGVHVQASTLGSLEALLTFLRSEKIPYASIGIGPVHKRDVIKASIMLEKDPPMWAVILAFDVKIERDAQELADKEGVKIFTADIIYHLHDKLTNYVKDVATANKDKHREAAVFPVKLYIMPENVFCQRAPIIVGVRIDGGQLRVGTPLCVPDREMLDLGRVASIEVNHKPVPVAKKGAEVCIRIEAAPGDTPKMYGRHFDHKDIIVSKVSRASIDALRDHFRDEMDTEDWKLVKKLKDVLGVL